MENIGVHCFKCISSLVIVPITRGRLEMRFCEPVFLHCCDDLHLVEFRGLINLFEPFCKALGYLFGKIIYFFVYAEFGIYLISHFFPF